MRRLGGLTEDSDISNVNLAYVLDDGIKIKIPSISETTEEVNQNVITEENGENIIENKILQETSSNKGVNINKANNTELETLPGIGASLAMKIIQYREQNGKFSAIEDLKNVNGIGDSKYENIKDLISVK